MPSYFENTTFKYLVIGLSIVMVGILVYEIFFSPKMPELPNVVIQIPQAQIDFKTLDILKANDLAPVEKIALPQSEGRENPFEAY